MALTSGTKLGPYEIVSPRGAGGMGEVYRGRDTRLDRTVAIKILPSHLSSNVEAKQRFEREARAISSLNHPNICTLYDVGHQDGTDFLVMEFLEGDTLADRLARGHLPAEQIVKYGVEICEGLERAHKSGVIHRDLKPANIMLTKSGAKLMDFGLAKSTAATPPASSLTMTLPGPSADQPLTAQGTIIGTFQYMSPEQIEGKDADARSDIFALGAVLYEMATGQRAFSGKTQASIVASILTSEPPPISSLRPMSPPALDRVVKTCLAKDPDERFQTAHDLKLQLKWIVESGSQAGSPIGVVARGRSRERWLAAGLGALALMVVASAIGLTHFRQKAESLNHTIRAQIGPPEHFTFTETGFSNHIVVSPDGSRVAFIAEGEGKQRLWIRTLDRQSAEPVAGSDGAIYPFWSGDSRSVGFFAGGKLNKVDVSAGVVQVLCDAPFGRGGTWNREGVILFAPGIHDVIYRVPEGGGTPVAVTKLASHGQLSGNRWPEFLPDGRHFLYVENEPELGKGKILAASLDSPEVKLITATNSNVQYANGRLLFVKDGNLVAQSFDVKDLELVGNPVPVFAGVDFVDTRALGNFSVSQNGILVARPAFSLPSRLIWLDQQAKQLSTLGEPGPWGFPRLSPDGRLVALARNNANDTRTDVWLMDVQRGIHSRLTFSPGIQRTGIWAPDSQHLLVSALGAKAEILSANGSGSPQILEQLITRGQDWSPDGRVLLVAQQNSSTGWDILSMPSSGAQPLTPLLATSFDEIGARFSPDGHWLSYLSNESGRYELYVIPFPGPGGRWQVSSNGVAVNSWPTWSRDGSQIYYRDPDGHLMEVDVEIKGSEFHPSIARQFFSYPGGVFPAGTSKDGRVLVQVPAEAETAPPVTLIVNWDAQLGRN